MRWDEVRAGVRWTGDDGGRGVRGECTVAGGYFRAASNTLSFCSIVCTPVMYFSCVPSKPLSVVTSGIKGRLGLVLWF